MRSLRLLVQRSLLALVVLALGCGDDSNVNSDGTAAGNADADAAVLSMTASRYTTTDWLMIPGTAWT